MKILNIEDKRPLNYRKGNPHILFLCVPSTALDEKKARFFVSSGLSLVNSGVRDSGSDSPVNELLSTYKEEVWR